MKLSHLFLCKVHFQQRKKNGNAITSQGLFATLTLILHNQREEFEIGEQTIGIFFVCLFKYSFTEGAANPAAPVLGSRDPVW